MLLLSVTNIPIINTDIFAHFKFDNNSGSSVIDSGSYSNNGTIVGADWSMGILSSALDFDGLSDKVTVANVYTNTRNNRILEM